MQETFTHKMICPGCRSLVDTIPAEDVPDQTLRACPECGEVFWEDC